jgi:DNA-directed RNA polymerase subunit H
LEDDINILKHELVPEQVIMKDDEKKELLERFKIKPLQLPKILTTDPVVKAIGAKEGDILKIIRKSPTAGTSEYYRIVVKKKSVVKK